MSLPMLDPEHQAREALASAVASFGPPILSNPGMLENVFKDLLPDSPREVSILVAAAQVDLAGMIEERIGQHVDADTAVRLSASTLSERRALDAGACTWAASEFARALGHPVSEAVAIAPHDSGTIDADTDGQKDGTEGEDDHTREPASRSEDLGWTPEPSVADDERLLRGGESTPTSGEGGVSPGGRVISDDRTITEGTAGVGGGHSPDGARTSSGGRSRRPPALVPGAVALVVILAGVGTFLAVHGPGPKPHPTTTTVHHTSTSISSTTIPSSTTTSSPGPTETIGQLVPSDDQGDCSSYTPPALESESSELSGLECDDSTLDEPVYGVQFDTSGEFEDAVVGFNSGEGFDPSTAASACPTAGADEAIQSYSFTDFPATKGQFVECFFAENGEFCYMWTLPSENTFLWTYVPENSESEETLEAWFPAGADPD